jgi:hypothetical protein
MVMKEQGSVVDIEIGLRAARSGVRFQVGTRDSRDLCSPKRPYQLRDLPGLQFNEYSCSFPGLKRSGLEIEHLALLLPRLKISGTIALLPLYAFMVCTRIIFLYFFNGEECEAFSLNMIFACILTYLPTYSLTSYLFTYLLAPWSRVLLEKLTVSQHLMEHERSLSHLQVPATCPYLEPDQSGPCLHIPQT